MIKQAKLSSKGQITVPKEVRSFLNVEAGDCLAFYFDGKEVSITNTKNVLVKPKDENIIGIVKGEKGHVR